MFAVPLKDAVAVLPRLVLIVLELANLVAVAALPVVSKSKEVQAAGLPPVK
jgi:hypothetical protein